ncbi:OmpA family protein [Paraliomyxa miuraensis]|uniref:OmpA family protein n=1 Tax=Paraliomyxa miuraensis TaxID=376150 RepID=UPI002255D2CC|nr:OmpA family protein [Paraliomyxa miuraensis]MCX4241851.1 OmpA family protein [Paraliomyxa miuraensis]
MHHRAIVPGLLALAAAALVPAGDALAAKGKAKASASTDVSADATGSASGSGDAQTDARADQKSRPFLRRFTPRRNMWEVGMFGGLWLPSDVIELHDRNLPPPIRYDTSAELGLRVGYYPLQHFGLEGELAMIPSRLQTDQRAFVSTARAHAVLQLGLWRIVPFALLGGGVLSVRSEPNAAGNNGDESLHVGGGIKFFVTDHIVLRLEGRDVMSPQEGATVAAPAHSGEVLLGFSLALGPRKKEAPPPPDTDGDGFLDADDACPEQPGIAPDGCPAKDTDGDGFLDRDDACADLLGTAPDGCPIADTDGDGFLDPDDACPEEVGVEPDGCPLRDVDGDGMFPPQDACPEQPESVNGFEDEDGCPDEIPEVVKQFTGVIEGIYFDTGKATIRSKSFGTLDAAVKVLSDYPSLRVEISGHTDSKGKRDKNLQLSQDRADSVKAYIVGKGVAEGRIVTRGAGPDEPIGDNKTTAGRQQNRRIEFELLTGASGSAAGPSTPPGAGVAPVGCTKEAKICPDGTAVGRQGPQCEFAPCPEPAPADAPPAEGVMCTMEVKTCPDGTEVGRQGPKCEFAPCPGAKAE